MRYGSRLFFLAMCSSVAMWACASIWGFQDAQDLVDGGVSEYTEAGTDGCAGSCVPAAPSGWLGPFASLRSAGALSAPCPPAFPLDALDGGLTAIPGPATCTCACGAPTGIGCVVYASYFSDARCTASCGAALQTTGSGCLPTTGCGNTEYFTAGYTVASGGKCTPSAGTDLKPADGGTTGLRLCSPPASLSSFGCSTANTFCLPQAKGPLDPNTYCVATTGDADCLPAFPNKAQYNRGPGTDTRACSPCTCGTPAGATCSASTIVSYSDDQCATKTGSTFVTPNLTCTSMGGSHVTYSLEVPDGGRCTSEGGTAVGGFTADQPMTVCCAVTSGN
jgi:hypothetical protein